MLLRAGAPFPAPPFLPVFSLLLGPPLALLAPPLLSALEHLAIAPYLVRGQMPR